MIRLPRLPRVFVEPGTFGTLARATTLSAVVLGSAGAAVGCLDRPVAPAVPRTSNAITAQVSISAIDKIDLLFAIDNSSSMADKQKVLADAVPDLVNRLVNPNCVDAMTGKAIAAQPANPTDTCPPEGATDPMPGAQSIREFNALRDIHIAVVSSSLGSGGADTCEWDPSAPPSIQNNPTKDDGGHLVTRGPSNGDLTYGAPSNPATNPNSSPPGLAFGGQGAGTGMSYQDEGFLAWDPGTGTMFANNPPGEGNVANLNATFRNIVLGTDQTGCGYEAQMEGWYRFLIEPNPINLPPPHINGDQTQPIDMASAGIDQALLAQRAEFLRPDSLVAIIVVSDEDDHSFIIGQLPALPTCGPGDNPASGSCYPASYHVEDNYGSDGQPFAFNYIQNFSGGGNFHLNSGTSACATNPYDPHCTECIVNPNGPGCMQLTADQDGYDLRQWQMKARFGWDPQYPIQRYVDGLTQTKVFSQLPCPEDKSTIFCQNPLFDDLPYNAAQAAGKPLNRSKFPPRNSNLVFLATIIGVPWQDIAHQDSNGKPDLTLGYQTAAELAGPHPSKIMNPNTGMAATGWDLILGQPAYNHPQQVQEPLDPVMIDTPVAVPNVGFDTGHQRFKEGTKHPVTGEPLGFNQWNSVNGHEWNAGTDDLEYACVFALQQPNPIANCTLQNSCDCALNPDVMTLQKLQNPLCEKPDKSNPPKGSGVASADGAQYFAKAYPGKRYLEIQRRLAAAKGNPIVASICAKNLTDTSAADYGYRPAVSAIIDQLKDKLRGQCLPRQIPVDPSDGSSPCVIIAAKFPKTDMSASPSDISACKACKDPGRTTVPDNIRQNLTGAVLDYQCLCEIPQFTQKGGDLQTCKSQPIAATQLPNGDEGWCYVDPAAPNQPAGGADIVKNCPANEKQTIQFVTDVNNTTLFITCLGAASGNEAPPPETGAGGSGAGGGGLVQPDARR